MEISAESWKLDQDQVRSAIKLIENYENVDIMFNLTEGGVTAIALSVEEFIGTIGVNAVEIAMDATCEFTCQMSMV
jgi:hypothetical protein